MPVIVSRAQLDSVPAALGAVKSNAQALAAIQASLKAADTLRAVLDSDGGAIRAQASKDIADAAGKVKVLEPSFRGSGTLPVGQSWEAARGRVSYLWMTVLNLQSSMPPGEDLGDGFGVALKSALVDLPATIGNAAGVALKTAVKATKAVAEGVAEVGGSVLWGFVKTAWPLLLIAGVGVGVYFYARKRIAGAVL